MLAVAERLGDDRVNLRPLGPETNAVAAHADGRLFLAVPGGDASLVVHVIEELFQHLGHCELAADARLAR